MVFVFELYTLLIKTVNKPNQTVYKQLKFEVSKGLFVFLYLENKPNSSSSLGLYY